MLIAAVFIPPPPLNAKDMELVPFYFLYFHIVTNISNHCKILYTFTEDYWTQTQPNRKRCRNGHQKLNGG